MRKERQAKAGLADAIDTLRATVGDRATIQHVDRVRDLLGGRWSPESKAMFIEG